jgi:MFS family permease
MKISALRRSILLGSFAFGFLSFALPVYSKQLGANALEIGGLFSIFALTTAVVRPLVGWAMDRWGAKPFFVVALTGYALTMTIFALSSALPLLYLARLVQGIASSFMWISAYTLATSLLADGSRGKAVGSVDESSARGSLYGAFFGFALISTLPPESGWKLIFGSYAVLAVVGAWLAGRSVPAIRPTLAPNAAGSHFEAGRLLRLMLIVGLTSASIAMLGPLLLIFLQDKFTTEVSTLALAYIPAALVSSFLPSRLGGLSDRFGRAPMMALGLVGSGVLSFFLPGLPSLLWLIALWTLEALGWSMASPAQEALVADLTGSDVRGRGYGLYTFAASLGATVGPLLGGWLYDGFGHAVPFYLNGAVLIAGAILVLLLLWRRGPGQ